MPDAIASLRAELIDLGLDVAEMDKQIAWLSRDGDLSGYLFRCPHRGTCLAYSDAS